MIVSFVNNLFILQAAIILLEVFYFGMKLFVCHIENDCKRRLYIRYKRIRTDAKKMNNAASFFNIVEYRPEL